MKKSIIKLNNTGKKIKHNNNNKIKSIIILLDNYGIFVSNNIDFILNNKMIKFYIQCMPP